VAVATRRAVPLDDDNDLRRERREKLATLRASGVDPYPYRFLPTHSAAEILGRAAALSTPEGPAVAIAGRLVSKRLHGKAGFGHLLDRSGRIQVYFKVDLLGEPLYAFARELDLGDLIGVEGRVFTTRTGETTVEAHSLVLLAKSLRPLPEKWHGLTDLETRYRQRYVDLIVNPEVRRTFALRTRIVSAMRCFLDERGFLEVETPVLQPLYGGASARPFVTQHNALGIPLYLRIANELYLKRLIVGGLERVYEFAKDFRNEGMDRFHNPEFTMLELYQAYADYGDMMEIFEAMLRETARAALGTTVVTFQGKSADLGAPWRRLAYVDAVERATGVAVRGADAAALRALCARHGVVAPPEASRGLLLGELFAALVEPTIDEPTFVVDFPKEISPLAKAKRGAPDLVERFEPFLFGMEVGNAFSELNDPEEQERRFLAQRELIGAEREEAQVLDRDFLRALEYGMPPTGGLGVGIDRVTMIFADEPSIRDVILFPQMRPEA
jgi:lysyl-tRNA synthetase class 2